MGMRPGRNQSQFENPPAGSHAAICYRIIDFGLQKTTWQGKEKVVAKVYLGFELCNTLMKDGRPFVTGTRVTASLNKNAQLRGYIRGWYGRDLTPEEIPEFDMSELLNKPCILALSEVTKDDGRQFINIESIAPIMQGMNLPPLQNESVLYDIDNHDQAVYESLPDWMQGVIDGRVIPDETAESVQAAAVGDQPPMDNFDDDIPF